MFIAPDIEYVTYRDGKLVCGGTVPEEVAASTLAAYAERACLGTATPLTKDGYYLTAYHCVEPLANSEKIWVAAKNPADPEKPKCSSAEIIWKSRDADIALLRSGLEVPSCFVFSKTGEVLTKGTVVAQCGVRSHCQFGRTREDVSLDQPGEQSVVIRHTARSAPGDSGGPLLDVEGKLLGIVTGARVFDRFRLFSGIAVRPNADAILSLIEKDRAQRETEPAHAADE